MIIHITEYYAVIRSNELGPYEQRWKYLQNIYKIYIYVIKWKKQVTGQYVSHDLYI